MQPLSFYHFIPYTICGLGQKKKTSNQLSIKQIWEKFVNENKSSRVSKYSLLDISILIETLEIVNYLKNSWIVPKYHRKWKG